MRGFEILVLIILLPGVLSLFVRPQKRPGWLRYVPVLGVVFIALHLLTEGYRWQMVPAYVITVALLLFSAIGHWESQRPASRLHTIIRITGALLAMVIFGLAVLIPAAMPVFKLPEPSGNFGVGTTRFSLLDQSRPETFTEDPTDRRELLIQVWYPAQPPSQPTPEKLWGYPQQIARRMTHSLHLPVFLFDHFELVKTHSHRDVSLAGARSTYPVLVFSHGYNQGIPPQNTVQMEELASHGYIVFSIGHSYESLALIHPNGKIVGVSETQMKRVREQLNGSGPLIEKLLSSKDASDRARLLEKIAEAGPLLNMSQRIWVEDTSFLLNELGRIGNTSTPRAFAGRLDMKRVGIFGMSFGGTVATDVCLLDSRCRAGINLDGLQYGVAALPKSALKVPFMIMTNESSGLMNDPVFQRAQNDAWYLTVKGSTHFNYTDFSLISPVFQKLGLLGPIEGRRMEKIMNAYILAFFDQQLEGRNSPLLKGASPEFPEVIVRVRKNNGGWRNDVRAGR